MSNQTDDDLETERVVPARAAAFSIDISPRPKDNTVQGAARSAHHGEFSIELRNITHHYGNRCVFRDVSARVQSEQVLIVTGANGSGKSTLLKIIAGLMAPSSGAADVRWHGESLDDQHRRSIIGYVAPDLVLYRELTAVENLRFFGDLLSVDLSREYLGELLASVGLRGRGRDFVGTYSSGMRQRLKYAFALLHKPPILLLDEPTANLDVDGITMVKALLDAHVRAPGGGVAVVATNEPRELDWSPNRLQLGSDVSA